MTKIKKTVNHRIEETPLPLFDDLLFFDFKFPDRLMLLPIEIKCNGTMFCHKTTPLQRPT